MQGNGRAVGAGRLPEAKRLWGRRDAWQERGRNGTGTHVVALLDRAGWRLSPKSEVAVISGTVMPDIF